MKRGALGVQTHLCIYNQDLGRQGHWAGTLLHGGDQLPGFLEAPGPRLSLGPPVCFVLSFHCSKTKTFAISRGFHFASSWVIFRVSSGLIFLGKLSLTPNMVALQAPVYFFFGSSLLSGGQSSSLLPPDSPKLAQEP